jgi:putative membrane-bound dehydrogenase-like protein
MISFLVLLIQAPEIRVPDGFEIVRVAGPPLVEHPIMAGFDDRGRLYVADTAGINLDRAALEKQLPGLMRRLEDADGDGAFDASVVFVDQLTFPQGALWHRGALYVCSPPGVWRFEDTDGDGRADKREMLVGGFDYDGNAADVHGPFLSPWGRLFWCHGRKGHEVRGKNGKLVSKALGARIWSMNPDGSDVEVFAGGGMDNPTELAFSPDGDIFGTVPLLYADPRRDGVVHWIYGGVYPRLDQEQVLAEFKRTGDPLGHVVDLGHTAPAGLVYYNAAAFGPDFTGDLFVCEFNTHRLMRVKLTREGSTFTGRAEPFAVSSNPDSHFTDVVEAPDGSLILIDTGGWFRQGCPTSQIAKPQIKGVLWRIRRKGGTAANGEPSGSASQLAAIRAAAGRDRASLPAMMKLLRDGAQPPQVRREAAAALGRIGDREAVPALLEAPASPDDRFLDHALTFALIEIGDAEATRRGLTSKHADVRRRSLIALDQMDGGALTPELVLPLLGQDDAALRSAATQVIARHPGWAGEVREDVRGWLSGDPLEWKQEAARVALTALRRDAKIQALIAEALEAPQTAPAMRRVLLEVIAGSGLRKPPQAWVEAVGRALSGDQVEAAIRAVEELRLKGFEETLGRIGADAGRPMKVRLAALRAGVAGGATLEEPSFALLAGEALEEETTPEKLEAIRVLGSAVLSAEQLLKLAKLAAEAGPVELPTLVAAFERGPADEPVGRALVAALARTAGLWSIHADRLEKLLARYPAAVRAEGEPLLARLRVDPARQAERLAALERSLAEGDPTRGRAVFFGKAKCFVCHRVGAEGGIVGPDLSKIGAIRERRDLLEAIAAPSAGFARGYEPMLVSMKDGATYTGRILREAADQIELIDAEARTTRLKRDEIFQMIPNRVSVMPEGLDRLLEPAELSDVIAFLRGLR